MAFIDANGVARSDLDKVTRQESQDWVRLRIAALLDGDHYAEEYDRSIVGEDDRGYICAAVPGSDDLWELFDVQKREHRDAATESLRKGVIGYLDLEYDR